MLEPGQRVLFSELTGTQYLAEATTLNKVSVPLPETVSERRNATSLYEEFITKRCQRGAWARVFWSPENGSDMWAAYYFQDDVDAMHFKLMFG